MSSAIVPFNPYSALYKTRRAWRAAYTLGRFAKTYGTRRNFKRAKRAVTTIQRFYRKRSKAQRRSAPSSRQTTRQFGNVQSPGQLETFTQRTLHVDPVPFPGQGADVGLRLGSTIKLSGVKICERITNPTQRAVRLHWCLVQPKDRGEETAAQLSPAFFREPQGNARVRAFVDAQNGDEFDFAYDCYGLNPDKFHIITHKKIVLSPKDNGNNFENELAHRWMFNHDKYYKFKKRFTFTTAQDTIPEHPILRVYWFQVIDPNDWNDETNQALELTRTKKSCVYFRNGLG